jgi:pimeloyl-ACP methyl ester carboxylesterase
MISKESRESIDVTVNHGLDGGFEPRDRRTALCDGSDVMLQARPIGEVVPASDRQSRIRLIERRAQHIFFGESLRKPGNVGVKKLRMMVYADPHGIVVACLPGREQIVRLFLIIAKTRLEGNRRQLRANLVEFLILILNYNYLIISLDCLNGGRWRYSPGMATAELCGFLMHYDIRGEGEPLLLLHGGMGIGDDWRHIFAVDPPGYTVIVPDLRGHGRSTSPRGEFTFKACAQDVRELLVQLKIDKVKAIGMSMGAKTLLHLATAEEESVEAMVLVSATPRFPDPLRDAAARFTRDALAQLPQADRNSLRARHVHGEEQIARLYDMTRSFATSYDDMAFTSSSLAAITARTLIVHGDRDPLYPVELAVELLRGIPGSALWVIPDGGHGPIFGERAALFRSEALAFLAAGTNAGRPRRSGRADIGTA